MSAWLAVNKRKLDEVYYHLNALKLKGGHEEVGLDIIKYLMQGMENEINNLSKDLKAAQDENERLLELFTEKDDECE